MATPGGRTENRLARETSPYLLQHRFNPVDWWAWGPEAFAEARRRDVPIFLSVGYSTCYWCHVMERESFENEAIGAQMSDQFVCIKVDREERPDVDEVYMAAVQAFTQRGGWPMSVFLEPHGLKPFWAGTYFPDKPKFAGVPAFPQVLESLSQAWKRQRAEVLEQANQLAESVRERVSERNQPTRIGDEQVVKAVSHLLRMHDRTHGGFGNAPKFPQPVFLDLLLDTRRAAGDDQTRAAIDAALRNTLTRMALGGLFDQVGGGFHRYSVDEKWIVPHFEKMLYDNGALLATYARAYAELGDELFARVARRTARYLLREMRSPEGGFYSAQDAEVNHREGQNYLWTREQMIEVLGPTDGAWAASLYGLDDGPNFQDPHHPGDAPSNVLFIGEQALARACASPNPWTDDAFVRRLDEVNERLLLARSKRDQPSTDDKILASWNGLAINGLSIAGRVLKNSVFISAAQDAASMLRSRLRPDDGILLRSFAKGRASIGAFLDDYANVAQGHVALHQALGEPADARGHLHQALVLVAFAEVEFADQGSADGTKQWHGYYDSAADQTELFVRAQSAHDGAMACGQSAMLHVLLDLARETGESIFRERAAQLLASMSAAIARSPLGTANSTRGLLRMLAVDRAALDRALAGAPSPEQSQADDDEFTPVEILSAVESVEVPADSPVGIVLRVRIQEGWHVTSADDHPGLVPFRVHIVSGSGVRVFADYPAGLVLPGSDDHRVYEGEFDLPVVLERDPAAEWKGTPLLAITYQPCTERACLRARTVELDLSIERA
ncbi:MAG: DUF255 domain-containing protein [Phycisphaerales bacterium]|nr:DUF255 domain-containing protein [Phycisphaerales bacterium]